MSAEQKNQRGVRLNVKLVPQSASRWSKEVFSEVPGLQTVIQTFPDETDPELSTMYIIEVNPASMESALRQLRHNPHVEYAEATAARKLIR
jgi:hypothetical protein